MGDYRIDDVVLSVSEACDLGRVGRARLKTALTKLVNQVDELTEQRDGLQASCDSLKEFTRGLHSGDTATAIIGVLDRKDRELRAAQKDNATLETENMDQRITLSSLNRILRRSETDD